ncbi:endonuclease/exonuclease/phosphatase family protein [Bernardetia sp. Wsw4-3y2]|uniref:endonuclease/exonuclease/phosphatase family protein n=1 Tax=Bernardetia sp. Wsw4-3y2 TaxID=3127471 RepID=UPI0030D3C894
MNKTYSNLRKGAFYIAIVLSVLIIISSILSLIYDIPRWYLKVLDFPRMIQFILSIIILIYFVIIKLRWNKPTILLLTGLISAVLIQLSVMAPYLLWSKEVPSVETISVDEKNTVGILLGNVLITNKNSSKFLEIIEKADPDMILAMEVDDWWVKELQSLEKEYPHTMKIPLDNAYGMALYSKFPLKDSEIKYLNLSKVPSFHALVTLPSGKVFKFYGVHPVAPMPSDKYPDNVGEMKMIEENKKEEKELLRIADLVEKDNYPSLVGGDLNDLAWGRTERLFGKDNTKLKDVRIGRGLYNTFDATSYFLRWPLDHFYVTEKISVVEFERLESFDSDHFPLYGKFLIE